MTISARTTCRVIQHQPLYDRRWSQSPAAVVRPIALGQSRRSNLATTGDSAIPARARRWSTISPLPLRRCGNRRGGQDLARARRDRRLSAVEALRGVAAPACWTSALAGACVELGCSARMSRRGLPGWSSCSLQLGGVAILTSRKLIVRGNGALDSLLGDLRTARAGGVLGQSHVRAIRCRDVDLAVGLGRSGARARPRQAARCDARLLGRRRPRRRQRLRASSSASGGKRPHNFLSMSAQELSPAAVARMSDAVTRSCRIVCVARGEG